MIQALKRWRLRRQHYWEEQKQMLIYAILTQLEENALPNSTPLIQIYHVNGKVKRIVVVGDFQSSGVLRIPKHIDIMVLSKILLEINPAMSIESVPRAISIGMN